MGEKVSLLSSLPAPRLPEHDNNTILPSNFLPWGILALALLGKSPLFGGDCVSLEPISNAGDHSGGRGRGIREQDTTALAEGGRRLRMPRCHSCTTLRGEP